MIDKALISNFPGAPISGRISGRDRPQTIRNRIRRIGNVLAKSVLGFCIFRRLERKRAIRMEIKFCELSFLRRPSRVRMPIVRTALKSRSLPGRLFAHAVQIITEKWSFDIFPKLSRGFMSGERNDADGIALRRLPLPMKPRARDDKISVIWVMFFGVAENLPWAPGIFLIPEASNVKVRHRRRMQLT